jgi:hypothetical protein
MTDNVSRNRFRPPLWLVLAVIAVALIVLAVLLFGGGWGGKSAEETLTPAAEEATPAAQASPTAVPACPGEEVTEMLAGVVSALENEQVGEAQAGLEEALSAYAPLMDQPACGTLAQELLGVQALVDASAAWQAAESSGSAKGVEEAARRAALAQELVGQAGDRPLQALATALVESIDERRSLLTEALDLSRPLTSPATLNTETAGGLHPLCDVNTVAKPLLEDQGGGPITYAQRMAVYSDTLFVLVGGQLMMSDLERVHGPAPAVFLQAAIPGDGTVAGARVEELVDLTRAENGDLLLLEKSGRVLRRTPGNEWSLEHQAGPGEMPVAIAPYGPRFYLLDPDSNQIWRFPAGAEGYPPAYFAEGAVRNVGPAVDMAIDGSIYVGRYDGFVRRYFAGVEDPGFQPDTELGLPVSVFLADEPESTLIYVVDGPGRRLLGLERETGLYRLGFVLNFEEVGSLTSAAISAGRLYLTDGQTLYITILTPTPTPAVDCPAFPFSPSIPFDLAALETLELQPPVSASIPVTPSHYPGGRWPQLGYGVLEAVAFTGAPFSDTVRAIVPGTISRIVDDPPPLLDTDMAIITTTGRVPADLLDAMWGRQIWIDHGDGIQTRYGGLAEILPSLAEGQSVRLFTILGYAGEGPLFLGLWADDQYVGYGRSLPLTIVGFRALFGGD